MRCLVCSRSVHFKQDYEVRIASLQEQVERNSMMSSVIRYDVEGEDEEDEGNCH